MRGVEEEAADWGGGGEKAADWGGGGRAEAADWGAEEANILCDTNRDAFI
jgi:hypothetical protein